MGKLKMEKNANTVQTVLKWASLLTWDVIPFRTAALAENRTKQAAA